MPNTCPLIPIKFGRGQLLWVPFDISVNKILEGSRAPFEGNKNTLKRKEQYSGHQWGFQSAQVACALDLDSLVLLMNLYVEWQNIQNHFTRKELNFSSSLNACRNRVQQITRHQQAHQGIEELSPSSPAQFSSPHCSWANWAPKSQI